MSRKAVSPRIRFEVFKRDKFTCQYCGAQAPDVVLQCDHIAPVAGGGTNDILNLITSCSTCNGGKGAIPLSDNQALERQRDQLAELEDRRQQIEMMIKWRDELQSIKADVVEVIAARVAQRGQLEPNENGKAQIRRWLKKFSVEELLAAADEAFDVYATFKEDEIDVRSWEKAFSKIPGVASITRQSEEKPYLRQLFYIQGIIRKRSGAKRYECVEYMEHLLTCGADIDDMELRAKRARSIEDFEAPYDAWLKTIGEPY